MRNSVEHLEIGQRFFAAREFEVLRSLSTEMRERAFFNCWTRKEAYIKAIGEGLSHPLDKFVVSLAPGEPAALLSTELDPQEASRWLLRELEVGQGYVAAVIAEGRDWDISDMDWQE